MKIKQFICKTLAIAVVLSGSHISSIGPISLKDTVLARAVIDTYAAYRDLAQIGARLGEEVSNKAYINTYTDASTHVDTAGNERTKDTSRFWKLKNSVYRDGLYNGYFTYQQKDIDAAAQVKAGKWLTNARYEAMAGVPTTENVFVNMGGSQWIVDLQYRVTETTYVRKYHFDAGVANYLYWASKAPYTYAWSYRYPIARTKVGGKWGLNDPEHMKPDIMTAYNYRWKCEELQMQEGADAIDLERDKASYMIPVYYGTKLMWFFPEDKFTSSQQEFKYTDDPMSKKTPNARMAVAAKKAVATVVSSIKDTYKNLRDNYRADQGLWDANKDGTNDHISWMYTYAGMIRNSACAYGYKRNDGRFGWATPAITTYFYDWKAIYEGDASGVSVTTDSRLVKYQTLGNVTLDKKRGISYSYTDEELRDLYCVAPGVFSSPVVDEGCPRLLQFSLPAHLRVPGYQIMNGNGAVDVFNTTLVADLAGYQGGSGYNGMGPQYAMGFCKPSKFLAFGAPIDSEGFGLDVSHFGEAFGQVDECEWRPNFCAFYMDTDGWNEIGYWYYYSLYRLLMAYGWMFYTDEISAVFGGLPGAEADSNYNKNEIVNKRLGFYFGGVTNAKEQNFRIARLNGYGISLPWAILPRGGDLDGILLQGNEGQDDPDRNVVFDIDSSKLMCQGLNDLYNVVYDVWIPQFSYNTYDYPTYPYCFVLHSDGSHCNGRCGANGSPDGPECTGPEAHVSPNVHAPWVLVDHPYQTGCIYHPPTYDPETGEQLSDGYCDPVESSVQYKVGCANVEIKYVCPYDFVPVGSCSECGATYLEAVYVGPEYVPCHGDVHNHYAEFDRTHIVEPANLSSHEPRNYEEYLQCISGFVGVARSMGNFVSSPARMSYSKVIGQKFNNVQWLDINSYQIWMMNKGSGKGLAKLLATPVTIDNEASIIETAVTNQLGYTYYNIDDNDIAGNERSPSAGKTVIPLARNLERIGRVANSFNRYSEGNCQSDTWQFEIGGSAYQHWNKRANILSYWVNDVPGIRTADADRYESAGGAYAVGHVNGDFHAFKYNAARTGTDGTDDIYFTYNPYAQGGRSHLNFNGFINQALAHTLYYCYSGNTATPDPKPVKFSGKVSYSNSIRIQGDYLALDYAYDGAGKTKQQPLVGYMYDTWRERDKSKYPDYSGGQFRLIQDTYTENNTTLSRYNCRCTWVPASLSYLLGRANINEIYDSQLITSRSNSWIIHTFCRGLNSNFHQAWDSIYGDVGAAWCQKSQPTEMKTVTSNQGRSDIVNLDTMLLDGNVSCDGTRCNVIDLKYFVDERGVSSTPYDQLIETFADGATYYNKYDHDKYYNIYAAIGTKAPWIGYGADKYDSGGSHQGFKDITKKGKGSTQLGYKVFETKYNYDSQETYVTSPTTGKKFKLGFDVFGYWKNHPSNPLPKTENTDKKTRGTQASGADEWSKYYPWLQNLNLNRYLANDRYTTGQAAIEYESVGKYKDSHVSATADVHTSNEVNNPHINEYYYKNAIQFYKKNFNLGSGKYVYVNAAYSPGKLNTLNKENFYGNPNDIVIYNPVGIQSAHLVATSTYLPDAGNAGTLTEDNADRQREYSRAYLNSFADFVVRDTRMVYKFTLDANRVPNTEQYISESQIFKQSIIKTVTTTEDVIIETGSQIPTSYYTMDDYQPVSGNSYEKWCSTSFSDSYTVQESSTFDMTYFNTINDYVSASVDLEAGDTLSFEPNTKAVIVDMSNKGASIPWSNFRNAYVQYKLSAVRNDINELIGTAYDEYCREIVTGTPCEKIELAFDSVSSLLPAFFDSPETTYETYSTLFTGCFSEYLAAVPEANRATTEQLLKEALWNAISQIMTDYGCNVGATEDLVLPSGTTLSIGLKGLKLRKGQLVHVNLSSDVSNPFTLVSSSTDTYKLFETFDDTQYRVFVEAMDDTYADDIQIRTTKDCVLHYKDNSLEFDRTVLMCWASSQTLLTDISSFYFFYGNTTYSCITAHASKFINRTLVTLRRKSDIFAFGQMHLRGFYFAKYMDTTEVVLRPESANNPHRVPNTNWKYYVLGWRTTDNHVITSVDDAALQEPTTQLKVPSGQLYFPAGFITVNDLDLKALGGLLGIYQALDGSYGLIDLNADGTYERVSKYTGYEITEGTFPIIDFCEDGMCETITGQAKPYSWFTDLGSSIRAYSYEAVFYASLSNGPVMDVMYSMSPDHKVTEDSEQFSKDYVVSESVEVLFDEVTYNQVFAKSLSLDDEFTIYWDNYTDLFNSKGHEGKKKNLLNVVTTLGVGWDNLEDSQQNLGKGHGSNVALYSDWDIISSYDYWAKAGGTSSEVTDTTKWIYNKYVIFNTDMYAFSKDKSYTYNDTRGPEEQDGAWDPTTPAYDEDGKPNYIVYIPAGSKVQLGYYLQRKTEKVVGTEDNSGRFVDYGYNCYIDEDGHRREPSGYNEYNQPLAETPYSTYGTNDPNRRFYTYHFWVPLGVGESMETTTATFVVNSINAVNDMDEDNDCDGVVDDRDACTDAVNSIAHCNSVTTLSRGTDTNYHYKLSPSNMKTEYLMEHKGVAIGTNERPNEWGTYYAKGIGLPMNNNVKTVKKAVADINEIAIKQSKVYRRYTGAINYQSTSIVGRAGNFTILDTGDPRYQDSFKHAAADAEYVITPIVKAVTTYSNRMGAPGSQWRYMTDSTDVRGRVMFKDLADVGDSYVTARSGDTYSSAAWYLSRANIANHYAVNDWFNLNSHEEVVADLQTVKVGYETICSFETIGNFYGSLNRRPSESADDYVNMNYDYGQTKVQVHPMYVGVNAATGEVTPVDAYMKVGKTYTCINAGSIYASSVQAEGSSDKGPYYLATTYDNKYPVGMYTNTGGKTGSTYILDQNMLRRSITDTEAKITFDTLKEAKDSPYPEVSKGITQSILEEYDFNDKTTIGGIALDDTYVYGNGQMLFLREYNRNFIGGPTEALLEAENGSDTSAITSNAKKFAQKWHFGISLPSSTVFVRHSDRVKDSNILTTDDNWYILVLVDIYVIGEKWAVSYSTAMSQAKVRINGTEIPAERWNVYAEGFPHAFPVCIYNLTKTNSTGDLDTQGSH